MILNRKKLFLPGFGKYTLFVGAFAVDYSKSEGCQKENSIKKNLFLSEIFKICVRNEFQKFKAVHEYNHENVQRYFNR